MLVELQLLNNEDKGPNARYINVSLSGDFEYCTEIMNRIVSYAAGKDLRKS